MNTISRRDLSQLAGIEESHLISIYMPTYTGAEHRQNPLRYKNLLRAAEEKLSRNGLAPREMKKLLEPAHALLDKSTLWEEQGPALAAFVSRDEISTWRLPVPCEEVCTVGKYFHLIPMVLWLNNDAPYYVLAVSQNNVRLLRGRRTGIEVLEVPGLPANQQEVVRFDDAEPGLQAHSSRPYLGRTKEGMAFHGHGGAPDAAKDFIVAFFRAIDRAVSERLRLETAPLIFAGVDYLFPIYQEVNSYPHLSPKPITGNPELWSPAEIQQRAWPIVEEMLRVRRETELNRYGNCISMGRSSHRVDEILAAAKAGAVETLFLDPAARCTGSFDCKTMSAVVDPEPRQESEDLVNLAAVLVLRNSGSVEPLDSGQVPGGGPMAATLRYPFSQLRPQGATAAQR